MDPVSLTLAIAPILFQATNIITLCHNVQSRFKSAPASVASIVVDCNSIHHSLSEVQGLMMQEISYVKAARRQLLSDEIGKLTHGITEVLECLQPHVETLANPGGEIDGPFRRSKLAGRLKFMWAKGEVERLLQTLRGHQQSLALALQVLHMEMDMNSNKLLVMQGTVITKLVQETQHRFGSQGSRELLRRISITNTSTINTPTNHSSITDTSFEFDQITINASIYRKAFRKQVQKVVARPQFTTRSNGNASTQAVRSVNDDSSFFRGGLSENAPSGSSNGGSSFYEDAVEIQPQVRPTRQLLRPPKASNEEVQTRPITIEIENPPHEDSELPREFVVSRPRPRSSIIKLVLLGDDPWLKQTLLQAYTAIECPTNIVHHSFEDFRMTVSIDESEVSLTLFDTAGQEDCNSLRPLTYSQTDIFLICVSVDDDSHYANVKQKWFPELQAHCPEVPALIVGIKNDAERKSYTGEIQKENNKNPGKRLARELGVLRYFECDIITRVGVKEVFDEAIVAAARQRLADDKPKSARWSQNPIRRLIPLSRIEDSVERDELYDE